MSYLSFEDLEVWKRSCRLAVQIYIADKLGNILPEGKTLEMITEPKQISSMLHGLIKSQ